MLKVLVVLFPECWKESQCQNILTPTFQPVIFLFCLYYFWREGKTGNHVAPSQALSKHSWQMEVFRLISMLKTTLTAIAPVPSISVASNGTECLPLSISLRFSPSSPKQFFYLHLDMRKLGLERFHSWPSVTQLLMGETRRRFLVSLPPKPTLITTAYTDAIPWRDSTSPYFLDAHSEVMWSLEFSGTWSGWLVGFSVPFGEASSLLRPERLWILWGLFGHFLLKMESKTISFWDW